MSGGFRQDEIDALLASVRRGDEPQPGLAARPRQRRVKPYDFSRPIKVDRDQMRDFNRLLASFCRNAAGTMSSQLRSLVDLRVIHGEQGPWREVYAGFPQPSVYGIVQVASCNRPVVFAAEATALSLVIDVMLGGPGGVKGRRKAFTDIDLALIRRIFGDWTSHLQTQWQRVGDDQLSLLAIETEHFAANVVPPSEPSVSFTIELRLGSASATIGLLCPHGSIGGLLAGIGRGAYRPGRQVAGTADPVTKLPQVEAEVQAVILSRSVPMPEVNLLGPGDRLQLESGWRDGVELRAGDDVLYLGRPGRYGGHRAIEVLDAQIDDDGVGPRPR